MMRDPDETRTPWLGAVRLICVFEVVMDDEDDCPDAETAGRMAKRQLEDALSAAVSCKELSRNHRGVLGAYADIELVELEPETNP